MRCGGHLFLRNIAYKLNWMMQREEMFRKYHSRYRNKWYIPILKFQWSTGRVDQLFPGAFRWTYEGFETTEEVGVLFDLDLQFQRNHYISFQLCVWVFSLIMWLYLFGCTMGVGKSKYIYIYILHHGILDWYSHRSIPIDHCWWIQIRQYEAGVMLSIQKFTSRNQLHPGVGFEKNKG